MSFLPFCLSACQIACVLCVFVCVYVCMIMSSLVSMSNDNWNVLYLSMCGNQMTDDTNTLWMPRARMRVCVCACYVSGYQAADMQKM